MGVCIVSAFEIEQRPLNLARRFQVIHAIARHSPLPLALASLVRPTRLGRTA